MAIHRSGPVPSFFEYICDHALIPLSGPPSPAITALVAPGQTLKWLDIPSFQRGISWDVDKLEELLQSRSVLLGNVILSQFSVQPGQFPHLPVSQPHYLVLVDGLQRFAVGTALLRLLHDQVLSTAPAKVADAVHFSALSARVNALSPFYFHNDIELLNHPRRAIADQYLALRTAVENYVLQELSAGRAAKLASEIVPLFLTKQVALDVYFNFNRVDLLGTFIGINTVRVDLGPVDLLRSYIIEKATAAGWTQSHTEVTENEFTLSLTEDQKPKQKFLPFVNAVVRTMAVSPTVGSRLFPSWNGSLARSEVTDFLNFVDDFEASASTNPFLREIEQCGTLPYSIVFAHYFLGCVTKGAAKPSFFTGGTAEDAELHLFLISCYRLVLSGYLGRTTGYLDNLVTGASTLTLAQIADAMSVDFVGKPLSVSLDPQWLELELGQVDKKRAPRVFNAMLLPSKATLGGTFQPMRFGRKAADFQVDHLIPDVMTNSAKMGGQEVQTLRNFAPLPTNQNRVAKATSCSSKLATGGVYATYLAGVGATHAIHPYVQWLVTAAGAYSPADLDSQGLLEKNSTPDIGSDRVKQIASRLLPLI
jgi:hypothetical protein